MEAVHAGRGVGRERLVNWSSLLIDAAGHLPFTSTNTSESPFVLSTAKATAAAFDRRALPLPLPLATCPLDLPFVSAWAATRSMRIGCIGRASAVGATPAFMADRMPAAS